MVFKKYKNRILELDNFDKQKYGREHPISWSKNKICCLKLVGVELGPVSEGMTYYDFIIRKEHKFIRNIYNLEVLS